MEKKLTNGEFQTYDNETGKFQQAIDSKAVKFVVEPWILKYTFFTHKNPNGEGWNLWLQKLISNGEENFRKAIQEAKQTQKQHGNKT